MIKRKCEICGFEYKDNETIDKIVEYVNQRTIENDMDKESIERIEEIRKRLVQRRFRK